MSQEASSLPDSFHNAGKCYINNKGTVINNYAQI